MKIIKVIFTTKQIFTCFHFHFSVQCNPRQIQHLWILLALHQNGNASCSLKPPRRLPYSNLSLSTHVTLSAMNCHHQLLFELIIRWGFYPLRHISWSTHPLKLSSWSFIRWSKHPLMHTSVDAHIRWCTHPLMDVIRWSFVETSVDALSLSVDACSLSVDTTSLIQNYKAWNIYT